jgi:hypothetical protein
MEQPQKMEQTVAGIPVPEELFQKSKFNRKDQLTEEWFIESLYSIATSSDKDQHRMEAIKLLGQLIHGFWKPYEKKGTEAIDVKIVEKRATRSK